MTEVEASRGLSKKKSMRARDPEEEINDKMFEDRLKERLTIAVVGGGEENLYMPRCSPTLFLGIGGLAAALALTRRGYK